MSVRVWRRCLPAFAVTRSTASARWKRAGTVPVVNAYVERMDTSHADLLLDSPFGRQFLAGFLGLEFGQELLDQLGLGQVPGTVALTAGRVRHRAPGRRQ